MIIDSPQLVPQFENEWTPNLAFYCQKPNYPIKARLGVLPILKCINNVWLQWDLIWMMNQRKSFERWSKEELSDDGSKIIFWMMVKRRSFGWRLKKSFGWLSKEGLLDDEPKKIFFMKAKKIFWMVLQRMPFRLRAQKNILDDCRKKIFWMKT